ncbi:MAG: rhomboid family intramembrane serine protease [Rhizobiales bacterium]|nr:rhomboid family intramembrane serine protease [Hyphomicrobiales bacterium]
MVMPIYDDNPFKLQHTPVVSWSLIGITIVAFIVEFSAHDNPIVIANQFGVIPAAVSGAYHFPGSISPLMTLVTYQFLHADIVHLVGNLIFLWVFADNVEQALGRMRFLAFYLLVGAAGALAFVFSDPGSRVPLIGASGSISGVVIAYLMLRPCAKLTALVLGIPLRISAYWIIGVFIAIQFINLGSAGKSDVAWWCHLGGMLAGGLLFPLMKLPGVKLFECIRPGDLVLESPPAITGSPHLPPHLPRHLPRH